MMHKVCERSFVIFFEWTTNFSPNTYLACKLVSEYEGQGANENDAPYNHQTVLYSLRYLDGRQHRIFEIIGSLLIYCGTLQQDI